MDSKSHRSLASRVWQSVERKLLAGFLAAFPLAATVWVLKRILKYLDNIIGRYITREIPGLGIIALFLLLLLIGVVVTSFVGRRLFRFYDSFLSRVPLARTVYVSMKQLMEALSPEGRKSFQQVVLLEYPRKGLYTVGLVTKDGQGEARARIGRDCSWVLLPHTPNVTSGVLLLVPKDEMMPLALSVEDGLKLIISGGLLVPDKLQPGGSSPAPEGMGVS